MNRQKKSPNLPRTYIPETLHENKICPLSPEQHHHLFTVLKLQPQDQIRVFNPQNGEFIAILSAPSKKESTAVISQQIKSAPSPKKVTTTLCFTPLKSPNTSLIIEKATELGIDNLLPVISERCLMREVNREKLAKVAIGAAEQSGRITVPAIGKIQSLQNNLLEIEQNEGENTKLNGINDQYKKYEIGSNAARINIIILDIPQQISYYANNPSLQKIIAASQGNHQLIYPEEFLYWLYKQKQLTTATQSQQHYFAYIGPEGGWSDQDREIFRNFIATIAEKFSLPIVNKVNVMIASTHNHTMRAETAAIATASWLGQLGE